MESAIMHTLRYFARFSYAPTLDELHSFISVKTTRTILLHALKKLKSVYHAKSRYALSERPADISSTLNKLRYSEAKIRTIQRYIRILSWFPQIRLIGLSGSVAMKNAEEADDIDLFVITARRRMWTARSICYLLSHIMGIRRQRGALQVKDMVCHNLFFDEADLVLPVIKQTEYGAHEVLQMKPLVSKGRVYEDFLNANAWIYQFFPNALRFAARPQARARISQSLLNKIFDGIEHSVRYIQLSHIKRHTTTEYIGETQLWFFPDDFEANL